MFSSSADRQDQVENEFRNIKLKLKGPNRHSELQAVKALMAMSAQQNFYKPPENHHTTIPIDTCKPTIIHNTTSDQKSTNNNHHVNHAAKCCKKEHTSTTTTTTTTTTPRHRSRSESPEPIYGLSITMTEEEFAVLAQKEGIKDVIGEPICKLCGNLFSGPLGIALHMCPAMKRQTFRCEICGEDKWKTKANLHSHIKWCKKRLSLKTEQHEQSKQIY